MPLISLFHDGCRGIETFVPSVRIISLGSTIISGIDTPIKVRTRKATYGSRLGYENERLEPTTYICSISNFAE